MICDGMEWNGILWICATCFIHSTHCTQESKCREGANAIYALSILNNYLQLYVCFLLVFVSISIIRWPEERIKWTRKSPAVIAVPCAYVKHVFVNSFRTSSCSCTLYVHCMYSIHCCWTFSKLLFVINYHWYGILWYVPFTFNVEDQAGALGYKIDQWPNHFGQMSFALLQFFQ